jgi:hypothetical protein
MTDATLFLRQIHPSFIQAGRVTSQAFRPTPKDDSLLSGYDGDRITPVQSYLHFINQDGCRSAGVLGVTVAECALEALPVRPDPAPFPEHVVIDFSGIPEKQKEKKAKRLRVAAEARDWLYQAPG